MLNSDNLFFFPLLAFIANLSIYTPVLFAYDVTLFFQFFYSRAFDKWKNHPNLLILGSYSSRRLPIFSFLVRHSQSNKLLHHNFISSVLNDMYGIQARGGCACAGPYATVSIKHLHYLSQAIGSDPFLVHPFGGI